MVQVVRFVALASCAVLLTGCSNSTKPTAATTRSMVDVSEAQAVHLTKDTQAKIKPGMTLEEVNAAVSPLLGQSMTVSGVTDDSVYEVGWQDPKTKKAIIAQFKGSKVTGTSSVNIQ